MNDGTMNDVHDPNLETHQKFHSQYGHPFGPVVSPSTMAFLHRAFDRGLLFCWLQGDVDVLAHLKTKGYVMSVKLREVSPTYHHDVFNKIKPVLCTHHCEPKPYYSYQGYYVNLLKDHFLVGNKSERDKQ